MRIANVKHSIDLEELSSVPFRDMVDFCREAGLEELDGGSGRIVFALNDVQVLKVAHTKPGVSQNKTEYITYQRATNAVKRVITAVDLESHDDIFRWIVCERVEPFGMGGESEWVKRQYEIMEVFLRIDPDNIDEIGREAVEELESLTGEEAKVRDGVLALLQEGHDKDELISEMQVGVRKPNDDLVFLDFGLDGERR